MIDVTAELEHLGVQDCVQLPWWKSIYLLPEQYEEWVDDVKACVEHPLQSLVNGPIHLVDTGKQPLSIEAMRAAARSAGPDLAEHANYYEDCHWLGHPGLFVRFFNDIDKFNCPRVSKNPVHGCIGILGIGWISSNEVPPNALLLMYGDSALAAIVGIKYD